MRWLCLMLLSSNGFTSISPFQLANSGRQIKSNRKGHLFESKNEPTKPSHKNYSGDASSLFGNLRIPASLFAGAAAGSAFALPLSASEGIALGMVKRIYSILMIGSLSSQIITVVVSTISMALISINKDNQSETCNSLLQFLNESYELEWVTSRLFFLYGIVLFSIASGMRAWVTIGCPIFSMTALGIIISASFFCLAFIQDFETKLAMESNVQRKSLSLIFLPIRFCTLVFGKAAKSPLFAIAVMSAFVSLAYKAINIPHIVKFLAAGN